MDYGLMWKRYSSTPVCNNNIVVRFDALRQEQNVEGYVVF